MVRRNVAAAMDKDQDNMHKTTHTPGMQITSPRAWWVSNPIKTDRGIVVARINAADTTVRYPSEEQIAAGAPRYLATVDGQGKHPEYMLDLTDEDLLEHPEFNPGRLVFPHVVDGPRPVTRIVSKASDKTVLRPSRTTPSRSSFPTTSRPMSSFGTTASTPPSATSPPTSSWRH